MHIIPYFTELQNVSETRTHIIHIFVQHLLHKTDQCIQMEKIHTKNIDSSFWYKSPMFVIVDGAKEEILSWADEIFQIRDDVHVCSGYNNNEANCIKELWKDLSSSFPLVALVVIPVKPIKDKLLPNQITLHVPSDAASEFLNDLRRLDELATNKHL